MPPFERPKDKTVNEVVREALAPKVLCYNVYMLDSLNVPFTFHPCIFPKRKVPVYFCHVLEVFETFSEKGNVRF